MKLKALDFKKFSNWVLFSSLAKLNSIRAFSTASTVKLYSLANLSIHSIFDYFASIVRFTSQKVKQYHYRTFIRPRGIAFVCGLQYTNDIHAAFLRIVNKNPGTRFYNLGAIFQALDTPGQIKLFVDDITKEELDELQKILTVYLTKANELTIPDTWDLIRGFLGHTWLLKKIFRKDIFSIFVGVMTPQEAEWLRKKRYYLVYLQPKEINSRWEKGITYCSLSYDLTLFDPPTEQTFMEIFNKCGLKL